MKLARPVVDGRAGRAERAQKLVEQIQRAPQQEVILPRSGLHPGQEVVVLLHQSRHQRPVIGGQQRRQVGQRGLVVGVERARQIMLELLAAPAGRLDHNPLVVDRAGRVEQLLGVAVEDALLLFVQQHQHLAILREFLPQRVDQLLNGFNHGREP